MRKQRSQPRTWLLLPVALATVALAACAPPPTPPAPDPVTPWFEPGCVDSSVPGIPDFEFNGIANEMDNAVAFEVDGVISEDGTCTGDPVESGVIIRAADLAGAVAVCDGLGVTVTNPARLVDFGYEAPIDAWTCLDSP